MMNVNGIANNLPIKPQGAGYGVSALPAGKPGRPAGGAEAVLHPNPDLKYIEKMALKPSKVSTAERMAQVISKEQIMQLLSLKNPMPRSDKFFQAPGQIVDLKS